MRVNTAVSALLLTGAYAAPAPLERRSTLTEAWNWPDGQIRGVNIGGWLVTEPWIRPSLYESLDQTLGIIDEYTLGQKLGKAKARQILRAHWDSWVTPADFQKIREMGFNVVRIPIGYWAFDNSGTPYVTGQKPYLDKAIGWASDQGLRVIIDLHGAPGSQNGFDNSGQRFDSPARPLWQKIDPGAKNTLRILDRIQSEYGDAKYDNVIMGIELLNEPLGTNLDIDQIKDFYRNGFDQQRKYSQNRVVIMSDAFYNTNYFNRFLTPSDGGRERVALDHHEYQVFSPAEVARLPWEHRQAVCNSVDKYNGADKWTFVGEWSAAMTDCAKWLNGYGHGARYEGKFPGSTYVDSCADKNDIGSWNETWKGDVRGYIEAQMESFEKYTRGWVFWNFKTENSHAGEWDAFALDAAGLWPRSSSDRRFSAICT